jgi:frataxin-like iron-binding protein CyaY
MRVEAAKASNFKKLPDDIRQLLIENGAVPVNDIYLPLWNENHGINLLYGSYGSGKSVFIADRLIKKSIKSEYFRCYFGRKIFDTVRGTVFQTIVDRIKEWKKEHLFHFSETPNGSMVITCRENGNQFIPFGANDSSSLKSIKDPTDFFCEELDQFTFDDFGFIYSRLRTEKATTQFWGAFNTERIYQSHWIRKVFFDGEFKDRAFKLKANYYDNYFINQEEYYEKLKLIANGNAAVLNAIANGEWGMVRTGNEFWKQFDESKHVGEVLYQKGVIWVSLDENVNPYVTQTIWQAQGSEICQIKELLCQSPDNNAPKAAVRLCDWLSSIKHTDVVFVCGDPSASKRSTVDANSSSFYDKYIEVVRSRGYKVQNKVMKSAPEVALSAAFINSIYESGLYNKSIKISDMCFSSIEDYIMVKEDAEGKMLKQKVTDPDTGITYEPRGHISDTKRYLILTMLAEEFNDYKGFRKSNLKNQLGYLR